VTEGKLRFQSKVVWWLPVIVGVAVIGPPVSIALAPKHTPMAFSTLAILALSPVFGSAPTLSLSRITIQYGRFGEVTISPKDRQGFIRAILARSPNVVPEDLDEYR
jgi:hypothetical protein